MQTPPVPDWQLDAKAAADRFVAAALQGQGRVAQAEYDRARMALTSTGRANLVARLALLRCATQVASLDFAPCTAFEALRVDADKAEQAYAHYLYGGTLDANEHALLPASQRAMAALPQTATEAQLHEHLAGVEDPLARLVAAAVWVQRGRWTQALIQQAVDTASAQGWRKPLLAWLGLALKEAERGGDEAMAESLRRRIRLVEIP